MSGMKDHHYADELFYPETPGAQATDTSRAAAASMVPAAPDLREATFRVIQGAGDAGMTADEAAKALDDVSALAIRPRVAELNKTLRIRDSGRRRKNESGRSAIVWLAVVRKTA